MRELYASVVDEAPNEARLASLRAEAEDDGWFFAHWLLDQDAPGDWKLSAGTP